MNKRIVNVSGPLCGLVLSIAVLLIPFAAQAETICGMQTETTLLAGQTIPAGLVTVSNDGQSLLVTYHTDADWLITETHLHVATSPEDLPQTSKGNAIPGLFDYQSTYDGGVTEAAYTIDLSAWPEGTQLYIAAHSVVVSAAGTETAWGNGMGFPGKDWSMYFSHMVQPCEPTPVNPGVIEFDQSEISVNEGDGSVIIYLVRNEGSDGDVTVTLGSYPITASEDLDYESFFTTITFASGETEKQIEVFILEDTFHEVDEQFAVYIEDVVGAELGSPSEVLCTINDNDSSTPR